MKRIIWSSVALVFCALVIVGGIMQLQSGRVECGGETMRQGDVCVSKSRYGRVTESTLEEAKTSGKVGAIIGIAIGALGILIGGQNLKIGIKNRKAAKAGAAFAGSPWPDAPLPQEQQNFQQQQYPPHQGYPQHSPAQGFPQQAMPPQPQYAPQQPPPQQHYYQPPQHQYYQPPGPGAPQR